MIKTLAKVGYAPIKTAEDAPYTYDDIIYFKSKEAGGREVSSEPKGETTPIYADGVVVYTADENAGYDHKVQLIDIIDKIDTDWLGNLKTTEGGILEVNSGEEKPHFALIVAKERFNGDTKYEVDIFFDTQVSKRPARNSKTSEGKFDPQFIDYELTSVPRTDNHFVRYTLYTDELPKTVTVPTVTETTPTTTEPEG